MSEDESDDSPQARDRREHRRVELSTAVTLRTSGGDSGGEVFDEAFLGAGGGDRDDHLGGLEEGVGGHGLDEEAETLLDGAGADLSLGGMYVRSSEKLHVGESVEVEFTLETPDANFDIEGTVRWTQLEEERDGRKIWGMGIQFETLTERQRNLLEAFVDQQETYLE